MDSANKIAEQLKRAGYRLTKARVELLKLITNAKRPFAADEVVSALAKKSVRADRTTVYRELAFLENKQILKVIHLGDGMRRYEFAGLNHHHHLVCTSCRRVVDVNAPHSLGTLERNLATLGWGQITHALEFFGTCPTCLR